ncbi:hypothetical protein BH23GEM9_BH23GEM9_31050 [soil metagenome]
MKSVSTVVRGTLALVAAGMLAACENPVSSGSHFTPDGLTIQAGTTVLVEAIGGRTQPTVTGGLTVQAGQQTAPLTLRFTDASGATMTPPQGYYVEVVSASPAVAQWQAAGDLGGTVAGVAAGTTTFRVRWLHGPQGAGHEETGWNVVVLVTP